MTTITTTDTPTAGRLHKPQQDAFAVAWEAVHSDPDVLRAAADTARLDVADLVEVADAIALGGEIGGAVDVTVYHAII